MKVSSTFVPIILPKSSPKIKYRLRLTNLEHGTLYVHNILWS